MRDITSKPSTAREATAQARVVIPADCIQRIEQGTIDKGDVREAARIAGMMAIKRCWDLLPHCHPIPLQHSAIEFELDATGLLIKSTVATIGPTGVEMEALTGASIAALTVYDMLKPHAGMNLSIENTRLLTKTGGKSDFRRQLKNPLPAVMIRVSSAHASGKKSEDPAADWMAEALKAAGFSPIQRITVAAEPTALKHAIDEQMQHSPALLLTVGGSGLAYDDCAIEVLESLIEKPIPGLMETARQFGQQRTPLALISRGVAGLCTNTLMMGLPGSQAGVQESWNAVLAGLIHALGIIQRNQQTR